MLQTIELYVTCANVIAAAMLAICCEWYSTLWSVHVQHVFLSPVTLPKPQFGSVKMFVMPYSRKIWCEKLNFLIGHLKLKACAFHGTALIVFYMALFFLCCMGIHHREQRAAAYQTSLQHPSPSCLHLFSTFTHKQCDKLKDHAKALTLEKLFKHQGKQKKHLPTCALNLVCNVVPNC